jgi:hypothetical protein
LIFFTHYKNIDNIKQDKEFNEELNSLLNEYEKKDLTPKTTKGKFITTCFDNGILSLNKHYLLTNWLQETLDEYFHYYNISNYFYRIRRQWVNCSFFGSEVKPHNHVAIDDSLIVVLYYEVPENCSKYVLINSNDEKESYKSYATSLLSFIEVLPGLSICHKPNYYHAVTEQKSEKRRISFVFDIEYKL